MQLTFLSILIACSSKTIPKATQLNTVEPDKYDCLAGVCLNDPQIQDLETVPKLINGVSTEVSTYACSGVIYTVAVSNIFTVDFRNPETFKGAEFAYGSCAAMIDGLLELGWTTHSTSDPENGYWRRPGVKGMRQMGCSTNNDGAYNTSNFFYLQTSAAIDNVPCTQITSNSTTLGL